MQEMRRKKVICEGTSSAPKKIAEVHIVETAWRKAYDLENLNAPSWPSRSRIFGFRSCGTRW
jgi:hypothetical protein